MYSILLVIQFVAIVILFVELVYAAVQRPSPLQMPLVILTCSTIIMLVGYQIELTGDTFETSMMGCNISYIGKPFAMMALIMFIIQYRGLNVKPVFIVGWSALNFITPLILFTNDYHHLYYSEASFDKADIYSPLQLGRGPLYYVYIGYIAFCFVLASVLVLREIKKSKTRDDIIQNAYLLGIIINSALGYIIYMTGVTRGYDTTMVSTFASAIFIGILFLRCRIFDSVSLAKDQALYMSSGGLIVFDPSGRIQYSNAMIEKMLSENFTADELNTLPDGESVLHKDDRVYEVVKVRVVDKGRYFGDTVELTDITDRFNYSVQLENEVENRLKEIKQLQRSVFTSFAGIVEARDSSTGEHINRIRSYVGIIARQLYDDGLFKGMINNKFIESIVDVSPLHDIGKMSIPDSILQKPGRLTPDEFEVVKTHTTSGAQIIAECLGGVERPEYVELAKEVALYHHEWYDGTGYPTKKAGDEIPLAARITAVADVYDAIRSRRCYKPPMDLAAAREVISEGRGTHFDPVIVDAFMRALPKIENL
ncbi:MAG: HD domain-containing protein [Clostridia bacterium]|nr:HD domain-containing protein [Clostridia bacterium]